MFYKFYFFFHFENKVSTKIYDNRDDFNFEIINFPFLDGDVSRSPSYGVYISQLIRFAIVCSCVDYFNNRNQFFMTSKLLNKVIDTINSAKLFLKGALLDAPPLDPK